MQHNGSSAALNILVLNRDKLALFLFCSSEILREESTKSNTFNFGKTIGVMLLLNLRFGKVCSYYKAYH